MSDQILKEAKRLHDLGFAVHWLKPNSKKPVESKWTTGGRKEWGDLMRAWPADTSVNVGVRLGSVAEFGDLTSLVVIDCDVKSTDAKHVREMEAALKGLVGVHAPIVSSGRGNGSRHIYCRSKAPVKPYRFTQSADKVEVKMPSTTPSPNDLRELTPDKIRQGFRIRAAWEISVMSDGQQVVVPPSVHPDTGKEYHWAVPFDSVKELPLVVFKPIEVDAAVSIAATKEFVEVDLFDKRIPGKWADVILSGEGVTDRSASLFACAFVLARSGLSDQEIVSVLTDRETFLGAAAFDHAETDSRKKAARWIERYTLLKVRRELSADAAFEGAVTVDDLDDAGSVAQKEALTARPWQELIERSGDGPTARPKMTVSNILLILKNSQGGAPFERNEFYGCDSYAVNTGWGGVLGQELKDIDLIRIKVWLAEHYRMEPPTGMVLEAAQFIAHENRFHPVRDYLRALKWDGVPRLDSWLVDYMGATGPADYVSAVGRKTLCAMVARAMEPGCKFDHVLVLEGPQGCGKSSMVRILADPWGSDAHINIGDKDSVLAIGRAWALELGELASLRKADVDHLKQFITQPIDRIRVPYGRLTEAFPRQCIFIGTTNSGEYLRDTTGNRRFWPIKVEQCEFVALTRDRDQIMAEARVAWALGESLYLDDTAVADVASAEQSARVFVDEWVGVLREFLKTGAEGFPERFTTHDLFHDFGPFQGWKETRAEQMRAAEALAVLGYSKSRARVGGARGYFWELK